MNTARSQRGFTLIEVMIAITILAVIMGAVGAMSRTTFNTRDILNERFERYQVVRNAMNRMSTEISMAFIAGPDHGGEEIPGAPTREQTDEEELAARSRDPIQYAFIGRRDKLNFTSFAHMRTQPDERSGYSAEIGYEVRSTRDPQTRELVKSLVRREDVSLDDKVERGGRVYTMIPRLEDVKFEYWDAGAARVGEDSRDTVTQGRWVSEWNTTRNDQAGRLPPRVRITVILPPMQGRRATETFQTQTQIGVTEVLEF